MKIALSATGTDLDAQVDARLGRAPYFLIVDTETMACEGFSNSNMNAGGGAGIQSAQMLAGHGVEAVLTGNCGPNAFQVFGAAGIQVIVGVTGPARQAVESFKAGALTGAQGPSVGSHSGMPGGGGGGMGRGRK